MPLKIILVTGTDTGVGKTLLTALLLSHLRQQGCHALAMKPFCSGSEAGLTDVDILYRLQNRELATHEINPFFFPEPLAPLVAARRHRCRITLDDVLERIHSVINHHLIPMQNPGHLQHPQAATPSIHQSTNPTRKPHASPRQNQATSAPTPRHPDTPFLLIEGAGGLLAPLGEGFSLLDIIAALRSEHGHGSTDPEPRLIQNRKSKIENRKSSIQTIIVAHNQLGTINHTLLTLHALKNRFLPQTQSSSSHRSRPRSPNPSEFTFHNNCQATVVLMDPEHKDDASSSSNAKILAELLAPTPIHSIPFLGANPLDQPPLQTNLKKVKRTLNRILGP